jgi:CheY-like chemotaxis protein
LGYRVTAYTDPLAAIDAVRQEPDAVDLVITDLSMPQMGGDRVIAAVSAIRPEIKTIIISGYNERIDAAKAREIGADAFIAKPHSQQELAATVRHVLDRRSHDR